MELTQRAVSATAGQARPSGLTVSATLGVVLGGSISDGARRDDLGVGVLAGLGAARPWRLDRWFVTGTVGLSASRTTTTERVPGAASTGLVATDLRVGAMAGRQLGPVSPYLLARVFGGPVLWRRDGRAVQGSDVTHVQLGAGATVVIPRGLAVTVDVSAVGERSASLAVALRL
ncbi:MAG: hypothetical protein R3B06_31815 [Kofleriaceae bacterium]